MAFHTEQTILTFALDIKRKHISLLTTIYIKKDRLLPVLFLPCFSADIDPMDTRDLKIELLTILADGCKKHPAYRALRPATGRCEPCVRMWQARLKLRELEQ